MKTKTLKEFEKGHMKFKVSRRQGMIKIREEINRDKTKQKKINETKSLFGKDKIDKPLTRLIKKKRDQNKQNKK